MSSTETIHVIIVEDDPFIAADIQHVVEEAGGVVIDIISAFNEALQAAKTKNVDLFTLDFEIISGTTEPVAKTLSEREIPFIAISGKSEKLKTIAEFDQSVILPKPLNPAQLTASIKRAIQHHA